MIETDESFEVLIKFPSFNGFTTKFAIAFRISAAADSICAFV